MDPAAQALIDAWHQRLAAGEPARPSPMIAMAIIRKRGEFLGHVEAPDRKAAEAAAVEEFKLNRRAAQAARV